MVSYLWSFYFLGKKTYFLIQLTNICLAWSLFTHGWRRLTEFSLSEGQSRYHDGVNFPAIARHCNCNSQHFGPHWFAAIRGISCFFIDYFLIADAVEEKILFYVVPIPNGYRLILALPFCSCWDFMVVCFCLTSQGATSSFSSRNFLIYKSFWMLRDPVSKSVPKQNGSKTLHFENQ